MRKPSATLVVAAAALVMATIGTSVAATGYTITSSRQIKPGSISLDSLSRSARTALRGQRGPAGLPGADGSDGVDGNDGVDGQDGQNATDLWAQDKADGSVNASGSGVTATQSASASPSRRSAQACTRGGCRPGSPSRGHCRCGRALRHP